MLLQLLDFGLRLLAGLALDLGGRLGILGPPLGFAQHILIRAAGLRNVGAPVPCPIVEVGFLALICRIQLVGGRMALLLAIADDVLEYEGWIDRQAISLRCWFTSCDRWPSLATYPKH